MQKNWIMPKWMYKYKKYISVDSEKTLEEWMNYNNLYFMSDPRAFIYSARVKSQVSLLERLHRKGII